MTPALTIVGLDLDNTLVTYDDLFHALALERGLIDAATPRLKRDIRDLIRGSLDGEAVWRTLQALAYGRRMPEATLVDGVAEFLAACRRRGADVHIVSHRTSYAAADPTGTDLRQSALDWMRGHGFFDPAGFGLDESRVWFESTRAAKIERIRSLGCTHFVDDLEEVFAEPSFPATVVKVLYAPSNGGAPPAGDVTVLPRWDDIGRHIFGGR